MLIIFSLLTNLLNTKETQPTKPFFFGNPRIDMSAFHYTVIIKDRNETNDLNKKNDLEEMNDLEDLEDLEEIEKI